MKYSNLIQLIVIIALLVVHPANAEITDSLVITGPDTIEQLDIAYFGVFIHGDLNQYTFEWSCDPESAGYFTSPQQVGTGFVTASIDVLSSLDVVISLRITTNEVEEVILQKNVTIISGLTEGSWSVSLEDEVYISDIAIDQSSNVYVVGGFDSTIDFDPGPGEDIRTHQGYDGDFLSSYDSSGNYRWTITIDRGEEGQESMRSVIVTNSGEIIAMGGIGPEFYLDRGDIRWDFSASEIYDSGFALRFNSDGEFLGYLKLWDYNDMVRGGITGIDFVFNDNEGNFIIAGNYSGRLDFDLGPGQDLPIYEGGFFVAKLDQDYNLVWVQTFGSQGYVSGNITSLCASSDNNVIVTGSYYNQMLFSPSTGYEDNVTSSTGEEGCFLCILNPDGDLIMNKVWSNTNNSTGLSIHGLVMDHEGDLYLTGYTDANTDLDPGDGEYYLDTTSAWTRFFIKWSADFELENVLEGLPPFNDFIAVDNGDFYLAGSIIGTIDLDPGSGETEVTVARSSAYVIRLDRDFNLVEHWIVPYERGSSPDIAVADDGSIAIAMGNNAPMIVFLNP